MGNTHFIRSVSEELPVLGLAQLSVVIALILECGQLNVVKVVCVFASESRIFLVCC